MKRITAIIITICLLIALIPVAFAGEGQIVLPEEDLRAPKVAFIKGDGSAESPYAVEKSLSKDTVAVFITSTYFGEEYKLDFDVSDKLLLINELKVTVGESGSYGKYILAGRGKLVDSGKTVSLPSPQNKNKYAGEADDAAAIMAFFSSEVSEYIYNYSFSNDVEITEPLTANSVTTANASLTISGSGSITANKVDLHGALTVNTAKQVAVTVNDDGEFHSEGAITGIGDALIVLGNNVAHNEEINLFWVNAVTGDATPFYTEYTDSEYTFVCIPYEDKMCFATEVKLQPGDVDGNGTVNAEDAHLLAAVIAGKATTCDAAVELADINKDFNLDVTDVVLILKSID